MIEYILESRLTELVKIYIRLMETELVVVLVEQFVVVIVDFCCNSGYALETNEADRTFSIPTEVKSYIHIRECLYRVILSCFIEYVHLPIPSSAYPQNGKWCGRVLCLFCCCFFVVLVVKYRRVKESLKKREFERERCMYTDKE